MCCKRKEKLVIFPELRNHKEEIAFPYARAIEKVMFEEAQSGVRVCVYVYIQVCMYFCAIKNLVVINFDSRTILCNVAASWNQNYLSIGCRRASYLNCFPNSEV